MYSSSNVDVSSGYTSGKSIFSRSTQLKSIAPERLCRCLYLKHMALMRSVASGPMARNTVGYVSIGQWSILLWIMSDNYIALQILPAPGAQPSSHFTS